MRIRQPFHYFDQRNITDVMYDLYKVLRRNISYGDGTNPDNVDGNWAKVANTGLANTEFAVTHNLNRIPVGFHIVCKDQAGDFYKSVGGTAWSKTHIYLKCSVANVTNVCIFIF